MYTQSQPFPEMLELIRGLKHQYGLEVAAVSNEGRELTVYRVQQFKLGTIIDFFDSSCFVHFPSPMRTHTELLWTLLKCARNKTFTSMTGRCLSRWLKDWGFGASFIAE
jgi:FMN phosphatase YigB (HAD superfamily)